MVKDVRKYIPSSLKNVLHRSELGYPQFYIGCVLLLKLSNLLINADLGTPRLKLFAQLVVKVA